MTSIVKYVLVLCVLFVAGYTNAQITINTNFSVLSNQPIDSRDTLTTLADTSSVTWTFPGLLSYVVDIDEFWYYTGTQWRKLFDGTTIPSTVPDSLIVYAPAHGLSDTIALYGYVPVKADFTRANSTSIDSVFIAYAIDAPDTDSLTLIFSGVLTYGSWHGKELNTQYYLQDDGSDDTTPGTVSVPTAIASDSLTLFLREVGSDIAGQLRRVAMPSPLITAFGGNPASPTDAVVQAAIEGTYLPAGLAQPGTVFTLSYATQSYNPTYQQTAPNTNPLTPSYAWLWDGALATRIVNIPTSVNLQDVSYGVLGTLVLLPIDSLMAASVPTDTEVALWLDTNYTANNLRLANGSLLYFIGDSTRQNPQYIWQVIDDISFDAGDTDWEKILKRIKFPVVASDGNGLFDAGNDGDTTGIGSVVLGEDLNVDMNGYDWLFDGLVEDDTTSRIMTLTGDGSLAYRWLDSLLQGYTTGTGTSGTLPIWTGTYSLGNSSLTEASGVLSSSLTGALKLPSGTDAQDPVWAAGMLRYNTTANGLQGYDGAAERYLPWADADNWAVDRIPYSDGSKLTSSSLLIWDGDQMAVNSSTVETSSALVVNGNIRSRNASGTGRGELYLHNNREDIYLIDTDDGLSLHTNDQTTSNVSFYYGNTEFAQTSSQYFQHNVYTSYTQSGGTTVTFKGFDPNSGDGGEALLSGGRSATSHENGGSVTVRGGFNNSANFAGGYGGVPGYINFQLYSDTAATAAASLHLVARFIPESVSAADFGRFQLLKYGTGARTGTHAYTLSVASDGKLVEVPEKWGTISTSTDGSGDIVVAHGMGVTPTSVQVTVTGTTPYVVTVHTIDATNFTVRFYDMTGAAVASTAVTATWHCKT